MNILIGLVLCHCLMLTLAVVDDCPNTDKCSCTFDLLDCSGRNLIEIPHFDKSAKVIQILRLDTNNISEVHYSAFDGIKVFDILLRDNNISEVDNGAFNGVESQINELDLSHNKLHNISTAIGTLSNIRSLNIALNPISLEDFDSGEDVLRKVGKTLYEFSFGDEALYEWPHTLRHLVTLKSLNVLGGSFKTLPPAAFHGFEGTLLNLRIDNTKLIAIPVALSRLMYLERLNIDNNLFIGDAGILVPAFSSTILRHLKDLTLKNDSLTLFPNILNYLEGVRKLSLESNKLDVIGDNSIKVLASSKVQDLSLRNCSITRVPGALSNMMNLTVLDLSKNKISTFERNDFTNMTRIANLTVSENPLIYISPDAFNELHNLIYLNLQDTNLTQIPTAIQNSKALQEIILPTEKIICTCDLAWLRNYMNVHNPNLHIQGTCETIISTIENYLTNFIPLCPNYGHVSTVRH